MNILFFTIQQWQIAYLIYLWTINVVVSEGFLECAEVQERSQPGE